MDNKNVMQEVNKLFSNIRDEMLHDAPIWMRVNFMLNSIGSNENKDVNWKKVNEVLRNNLSDYDFNIFEVVTTKEQLLDIRSMCIQSSCGIGVFQKHTCKECGEDFYLTQKEVEFFKSKDFKIPKRCRDCRKGNSKPKVKKNNQQNNTIPVEEKTAFALALEKAMGEH